MKKFKRRPEYVEAERIAKNKKVKVRGFDQPIHYHAVAGQWEVWKVGASLPEVMDDKEFQEMYQPEE